MENKLKQLCIWIETENQSQPIRSSTDEKKPDIAILQGFLFTYSIENTIDLEREEIIVSKNVNNNAELSELFDILTKPEFLSYREDEQIWFIETIEHYLSKGDDFESVFYLFDTHFENDITDKRAFMAILLERLKSYHNEADTHKSKAIK